MLAFISVKVARNSTLVVAMATKSSHGDNAIDTAHSVEAIDAKDTTSTTSNPVIDSKGDAAAAPISSKEKWFHWHEPGTSKEEKRLIFKLDWFLLSYTCLMFFIKQVGNFANERLGGGC